MEYLQKIKKVWSLHRPESMTCVMRIHAAIIYRNYAGRERKDMIIETQDGEIVDIHEITMQGNEISCKDPEDKRRKKVIGVYADRRRATEIYAEIACADWNETKSYKMPEA